MRTNPSIQSDRPRHPSSSLPEWNLPSLKRHVTNPAFQHDLARADAISMKMAKYEGKVAELDQPELDNLLTLEQNLATALEQITTPVEMLRSADLLDTEIEKLAATLDDRLSAIAARIAFLDAELAALGAEAIHALAKKPGLSHHAPQLHALSRDAAHSLPAATEKLLEELNPTAAWLRRFDAETASMRFHWKGANLEEHEIDEPMHDPDIEIRRAAHAAYRTAHAGKAPAFAAILDEIVRLGLIENDLRKRPAPEHAAMVEAGLRPEDLAALEAAAENARPLQARWIKTHAHQLARTLEADAATTNPPAAQRLTAQAALLRSTQPLQPGDLAAEFPGIDEFALSFDDAFNIVVDAWSRYCPGIAKFIPILLADRRIDARPRTGKEPGALCHTGATGGWILMTWQGRFDCLMTLAHEIGHAIHGDLMQHLPHGSRQPGLMMSETFAILSELLAAEILLERAPSPRARKAAQASTIRARALYLFDQMNLHAAEKEIWRLRRSEPLTAENLNAILARHCTIMDENGRAVAGAEDADLWPGIWHLFHAPFYLMSYGAAECLAGALYAKRGQSGFQALIADLMIRSGKIEPAMLLKENGIDLSLAWPEAYREMELRIAAFEAA